MAEKIAKGSTLQYSTQTSPDTWISIVNVESGPAGPTLSQRFAEAIVHDEDGVQKKPYVTEASDVTFGVLYDSDETSHAALRDAAKNGTLLNFKETKNDTGAEIQQYAGYVSFAGSSEPTDFSKAQVTVTVDGLPSYT